MKISAETVSVLKNFAKINPSIVIAEGNVVKTVSPSKTIMAKATLETKFTNKFAIYNLDRFLSTISLFNDPSMKFKDRYVEISDEHKTSNYTYADESTIITPPAKEIVLPSVEIQFQLKHSDLKDVEKAAGVLGLPEIAVVGDGSKIMLQAIDSKVPSGDTYSVVLGETDKEFRAIFKSENIKIIPGDYSVSISAKGVALFKGENIEYWIAVEKSSTI